jgi:hypothetical protein
MNPLEKLVSWWRGPTDPESVAATPDAQHAAVNRDTIRVSQDTVARVPMSPPGLLPTPDVLDPGHEDKSESS